MFSATAHHGWKTAIEGKDEFDFSNVCYAATFVVKSPYVFLSNPNVACEAEVQTKFSESKDCVAHHLGWYFNAHLSLRGVVVDCGEVQAGTPSFQTDDNYY